MCTQLILPNKVSVLLSALFGEFHPLLPIPEFKKKKKTKEKKKGRKSGNDLIREKTSITRVNLVVRIKIQLTDFHRPT